MRLREFDTADKINTLVMLLNFMKQRANELDVIGKISFESLINSMNRAGYNLTYDEFVEFYESIPAVKNLVKSFNTKEVIIQPQGDEADQVDASDPKNIDEPSLNKVDKMAKRALRKRM